MGKILENIHSPEDLKQYDNRQLEELAGEIREFLIEKVSRTGGHLASNLGVVELTLALHKVFSTPKDRIVWDVGHQSYVHKIITGRRDRFDTLRQIDGISGFPKVKESVHDCFNTGHSSTSISAALGIAKARDIRKESYSVVAVIGDGALTGGIAFEALNDAGRSPNNLIVILNDNEMSITKNVGGLSKYLNRLRTQPTYFKVKEDIDIILNKIPAIGRSTAKVLSRVKGSIKYMIMPGVLFEELGFKYIGPIDGHDISELQSVLARAKEFKGPILIHVCTQKGKGYSPAEEKPHIFHGIAPFEVETGELKVCNGPGYSEIFGRELVKLAERDERIVAVTAAMTQGTGMEEFSKKFGDRFFDVGIAEQHAVCFAAGLARNGMKPVVAVYSSFLQRAYDQILHDVALQSLPVVFAVDRAGIVGEDGETHQGLYDLSYLLHIPNLTLLAPCDYWEFARMLEYAVSRQDGPVAIRYPRGRGADKLIEQEDVKPGKAFKIREGSDITIVSIGNMLEIVLKVAFELQKLGISSDVINARFAKPLDDKLLLASVMKTKKLATLEDNTIVGGFGAYVLETLNQRGINVKSKLFGFPDVPVVHGSKSHLYKKFGLDAESVAGEIIKMFNRSKLE